MKFPSLNARSFQMALAGLALILTACNAETLTPQPQRQRGGMSGGGGGTLPAEGASIYDVEKVIVEAKYELRPLVRYLSGSRPFEFSSELNAKLFGGTQTLATLLEEVKLDIRSNSPCFDRGGAPVDGSVANTREGAICLSSKLIAPKVTLDSVRVEVAALILHELSHLLDTDEPEAQLLQQVVTTRLRRFSYRDVKTQALGFHTETDRAKAALITLREKIQSGSADERLKASEDLTTALNSHAYRDRLSVDRSISILDARGEYHLAIQERASLFLHHYLLCQSSRSDRDYWCETYEKHFGNREELSPTDLNLVEKLPATEVAAFSGIRIRKVKTPEDLAAAVDGLYKYFSELSWYAQCLYFGAPIPFASHPAVEMKTEMFQKWVGEYQVISYSCTSPRMGRGLALKGLSFRYETEKPGRVIMRKIQGSGWGETSVYEGANDNSGKISMTGTVDQPSWTSTQGDSWKKNWSRTTRTLIFEKGTPYFDESIEWEGYSGFGKEACRYELRRLP